jgi:proline iminopeptidase
MLGPDPEWTVGGTLAGYDPRPQLAGFHVPTLILVGRDDRIASPAIADELRHALPAATTTAVIFENAGHHPWVEQTSLYFERLERFLDGRSGDTHGP